MACSGSFCWYLRGWICRGTGVRGWGAKHCPRGQLPSLPGLLAHLEAVEVCEEGVLALDVRAEAQGQLLVDVVTDVHQARHVQGQAVHPCGPAVSGWAPQGASASGPGLGSALAQPHLSHLARCKAAPRSGRAGSSWQPLRRRVPLSLAQLGAPWVCKAVGGGGCSEAAASRTVPWLLAQPPARLPKEAPIPWPRHRAGRDRLHFCPWRSWCHRQGTRCSPSAPAPPQLGGGSAGRRPAGQ